MKVLGINGSSPYDTKGKFRPHAGSTLKLLTKVLGAAEAEGEQLGIQVETDIVHLHEEITGFYQGNYDYLPDYMVPTFRKMIEADAIVFASPVQWYSMSDYMKSFINHCTAFEYGADEIGDKFPGLTLKDGRQLAGKVAAAIATCHHDGCMQVIQQMVAPFNDHGMIFVPGGSSYYNNKNWRAAKGDEDGKWQNEDWARVGQNLVRMFALSRTHIDPVAGVNNWEARED